VDVRDGAGARSDLAALPGQFDVDEMLKLVAGDGRPPPGAAVRGELVSPGDELAAAFAATLVARQQTQRTCACACRRFARWLADVPRDVPNG
jgi:hypothetical protein